MEFSNVAKRAWVLGRLKWRSKRVWQRVSFNYKDSNREHNKAVSLYIKMEKVNNRSEEHRWAFRPFNRKLSNTRYLVVPPSRFVACRLVCGLKELYAGLRSTNSPHKKASKQDGLLSRPATKLAERYKVLQLIGQGQSSIIVAAEDLYHPSKKVVAVKIMNLDYTVLGTQEADCIYQLNRADALNVSKIVRLLNKFVFQEHFCMVFELLRPRPLHLYFQESYFNSEGERLEKIREVAVQVLQALAFLRRENVIHADLKPENILYESGGHVKVVDFGNAIKWLHCEMSLYYDNFELQTLLYRAPEVVFGVPFGPEVDMWSLGCILAELYLGKPLFIGKDKTEVLQQIVSTLGPLPRIPFQSGKFYSDFAGFLNSKTGSDAALPEIRLMQKLNSTKNFTFANFLSGMLQYNPNKRFTPIQAISHPFLAACVPFGEFLRNRIDESQGCQEPYSGVLLTSADYQHRPHIDDDIRRQHLSAIDLLYAGTQGITLSCDRSSTPPVGRVVPLVVCEQPQNTEVDGVSSISSSHVQLAAESTVVQIHKKNAHITKDMKRKQCLTLPKHENNKTSCITAKRKFASTTGEHISKLDDGAGLDVISTTARTQVYSYAKKIKHDCNEAQLDSSSTSKNTAYQPSTCLAKKSQPMNLYGSSGKVPLIPAISQPSNEQTVSLTTKQHSSTKKKTRPSLMSKRVENNSMEQDIPLRNTRHSLKLNDLADYDVLLL